jgi:hypothetical protein
MQPTPRIVYTIPVSIEFSLTTIVAKWILHFALKIKRAYGHELVWSARQLLYAILTDFV